MARVARPVACRLSNSPYALFGVVHGGQHRVRRELPLVCRLVVVAALSAVGMRTHRHTVSTRNRPIKGSDQRHGTVPLSTDATASVFRRCAANARPPSRPCHLAVSRPASAVPFEFGENAPHERRLQPSHTYDRAIKLDELAHRQRCAVVEVEEPSRAVRVLQPTAAHSHQYGNRRRASATTLLGCGRRREARRRWRRLRRGGVGREDLVGHDGERGSAREDAALLAQLHSDTSIAQAYKGCFRVSSPPAGRARPSVSSGRARYHSRGRSTPA
jgi:hypothetical protein